jgi:hypothetical protein
VIQHDVQQCFSVTSPEVRRSSEKNTFYTLDSSDVNFTVSTVTKLTVFIINFGLNEGFYSLNASYLQIFQLHILLQTVCGVCSSR